MKIFSKQQPWYSRGLAFECTRCGRCCAGPREGYVWITPGEMERLAAFLGESAQQVRQHYTRRVRSRVSLLEDPDSKDCIFLRYDASGQSRCSIHPARPTQCRTWPFWPANLDSAESWCLAALRCPGINRGAVHQFDEIQRKQEQTRC